MPPKKTAKNTKKGQNPSPQVAIEDPKPVSEEPKQEVLLPPPAQSQKPQTQEKPPTPAKEPEHKAETIEKLPVEERKQDGEELEKGAAGNLIKLNQFNNFAVANPVTGGGKAAAISEEEKKKLREMRFAGKHVAENTFDVSNVREFFEGIFSSIFELNFQGFCLRTWIFVENG